jgi:hypothetical protein
VISVSFATLKLLDNLRDAAETVNTAEALNPVSTVSEMKFTTAPALTSQPMKAIVATISAVHEARAAKRDISPAAIPARDDPISREIAEVTVIAVCRELQNNQKTSPEKRQA